MVNPIQSHNVSFPFYVPEIPVYACFPIVLGDNPSLKFSHATLSSYFQSQHYQTRGYVFLIWFYTPWVTLNYTKKNLLSSGNYLQNFFLVYNRINWGTSLLLLRGDWVIRKALFRPAPPLSQVAQTKFVSKST